MGDPIDNSMNSNDLVVSFNNFTAIDPYNYYGNGDTHAIGIQGGSRSVYEHNIIDGAGGCTQTHARAATLPLCALFASVPLFATASHTCA